MNGSVKLNNFIQTESLVQIGAQLLKKEFVGRMTYLLQDEIDENTGDVIYKKGFYSVVEVDPVPPSTVPTYSFKYVEIGGALKFKDTLNTTNQDYLYEGHNFREPDWDEINKFMKNIYLNGSCSGFVRDGVFHRSFDFLYNDTATFIVHNHTCGFVGIAGGIPSLTKEVVDRCQDDAHYDYVPFHVLDGINRSGIAASIFMVEREGAATNQNVEGKREITTSMLVSYILTNLHDISDDDTSLPDAKTGKQKLEAFMAELNIVAPNKTGSAFNTEYHYLVSDGKKTFAIEFIDNVTTVIDISNAPYITNFYLNGYDPTDVTTLNLHCQGVERYNIIKEGGNLRDVKYTQAYSLIDTDKVWRSDYNGSWTISGTTYDINKTTPDDDPNLATVYAACKAVYENRERGDGSWHTQHAVTYDFKTRSFKICTQENYDLWWLPENEKSDIEKYLNRERNDMLNWLSIATSDRKEYLNSQVSQNPDDKVYGQIVKNDAKSELYHKDVYDITMTFKLDIIHDGLTYHTYDSIPLFNEVSSIVTEPDSFLAIYPKDHDPEVDISFADDIVKALYTVEDFENYLKSTDFDEEALFVKITGSKYKRFANGETRYILYAGNSNDYDEIDRARTFRKNEMKLALKGFSLGKNCKIDYNDNNPRYFESTKGIFISSLNGAFKEFIEHDDTTSSLYITVEKQIVGGVEDDFHWIITFHSLIALDFSDIQSATGIYIRAIDVTPNKQGKEENADNLRYTKTGIYRNNYAGTQEVEFYNKDDTKSTISDIGYAIESALLNTRVNRNQLNNITNDLMRNIIYCPDDTIYFPDERVFVFYQAGKERGFSSDEFHKLVLEEPSLTLDIPNLTCLLWKGNIYQNRSGVTKTITIEPVEKNSQNITDKKFYIIDWLEPVKYNLYEGEVEVKPDWVKLTVEEYVSAYADYTAAFWDDRSFTANSQVLNHGVLEPIVEESAFPIIDAISFSLDANNKLVIDYEDDTYESHYVYDKTDPTLVIGKEGTGHTVKFKYENDTFTFDYKFPLNKDIQDKAMYCRAESDQSQNWERNDFAVTNMPTCNAGQEKIEGVTVNRSGKILNYGFVGIGVFQWCEALETDYVPYQSFRIEDPANPGSYLVDFNEGSMTIHFAGEGDEQLIRFEEILNTYWDDLNATQKAAELAKIHKYTLKLCDYTVDTGNIKKPYSRYIVNEGWKIIGDNPDIFYDDKECIVNVNMKFTPYDPNTMTCEPYEYTNIPLKKMPCPANLVSASTGTTALDICPISIKVTNNKGIIELGDNVTDFHWELTYRYVESPKDYIRLDMPRLFGATASDTDDMGRLNPDFFALLKSNIKSITLDV